MTVDAKSAHLQSTHKFVAFAWLPTLFASVHAFAVDLVYTFASIAEREIERERGWSA